MGASDTDGPGVTADTVAVSWRNFAFDNNPDFATQLAQGAQALVDAFNEDGGISGRDVTLITDDPGTPLLNQRAEALASSSALAVPDASGGADACAAYADQPVFALIRNPIVSVPLGSAAAAKCLNAQGQIVVGVDGWSTADYAAAPATAGLALATDRYYKALVAAGEDAEFFAKDAKTALITSPEDASGGVEDILIQALEDVGVTDPAIHPVSAAASEADLLNTVVKLKSEGVDHVIFTAPNMAAVTYGLLPVMQQQSYLPRMLALDSLDWTLLQLIGTVTIDDALQKALALYSSQPRRDEVTLSDAQKKTPAGELYESVIAAHPELANYVDLDLADGLYLIKAALEASGDDRVNATAFSNGLNDLTDYESPRLYATSFGPDAHDGSSGIVRMVYGPDCGCSQIDGDVVSF